MWIRLINVSLRTYYLRWQPLYEKLLKQCELTGWQALRRACDGISTICWPIEFKLKKKESNVSFDEPKKGRKPPVNVKQEKLCVCREGREPGVGGEWGADSSSVVLTWDQPLRLFGDLRSMRVGWAVGRALWVCALLFALLVAFSFLVSLALVLNISNHHTCGFSLHDFYLVLASCVFT